MARWGAFGWGLAGQALVTGLAWAQAPPDVGLREAGEQRLPSDSPYAARWGKGGLKREGGSEGTMSAVWAALRWLARHQSPDGRWDPVGWEARCRADAPCTGPGSNRGEAGSDVGVTALALLAFMGDGHSHVGGLFKAQVRDGLSWLCSRQEGDGSLGHAPDGDLEDHALATLALVEAYALTRRDPALQPYAQRALSFCAAVQDPEPGETAGIRPGRRDASATGWLVQALWAGAAAGLDVPASALPRAERSLQRAADLGLTGLAVFNRVLLGAGGGAGDLREGIRVLTAAPPRWPDREDTRWVDFSSWFWGTYAVFQAAPKGAWEAWNGQLLRALLPWQRCRGCEDGSWDAVGPPCVGGGRISATAMNALSLQVYYRLPRQPGADVRLRQPLPSDG